MTGPTTGLRYTHLTRTDLHKIITINTKFRLNCLVYGRLGLNKMEFTKTITNPVVTFLNFVFSFLSVLKS